jgi:hypothetical protein
VHADFQHTILTQTEEYAAIATVLFTVIENQNVALLQITNYTLEMHSDKIWRTDWLEQ